MTWRGGTEVVAVYATRPMAEIARGVLQTDGIEAHLLVDDSGGLAPPSALAEGVRIIVPVAQAARARRLLTLDPQVAGTAPSSAPHTVTTRIVAMGLAGAFVAMILYQFLLAIS